MLGLPFRHALALPGVLVAMTLVLVLVAVGGIAAQTIGGPTSDGALSAVTTCTRWNLAEDWRSSPNQENPSRDSCGNPGVWNYMSSDLSRTTYNLLAGYWTSGGGIQGLEHWSGPYQQSLPDQNLPMVSYNASGSDQDVGGGVIFAADAIQMHPWTDETATAGWRSPIDGVVSVVGRVTTLNPCTNGVRWYVDKNTTNLASGVVLSGGSQQLSEGTGGGSLTAVTVVKGDYLYLAIDPNGDYSCDATRVDLTITLVSPLYSVSGRAANASQTPLAGVKIAANATPVATTDAAGNYAAALPAGAYLLSPSSYCKVFSPPQRGVSVPPAATGLDFTGTDAGCVTCTRWSLAEDFRAYPDQENPSRDSCGAPGVWRYGYGPLGSHDPQTYTLFNIFDQAVGGVAGLEGWYSLPSYGYTERNVTSSDISAGPEFHQAGRVNVHPQNNYNAVNTWTSPITGPVSVTGAVTHRNVCGNGVNWSIDKGGTTLASGSVSVGGSQDFSQGIGGSSLANISVVAGDTISLIVDANGEYSCDSSQTDFTITQLGPFYSVSGRVANASQTPAPAVPITIGGTPVATTDDAGRYTASLPAGAYAVVPSERCLRFSPDHRDVTVPPTVTDQDFTVSAGDCLFLPNVAKQPTLTPTITPTPTSTPTPTAVPVDYIDDFSNPASGWFVGDVDNIGYNYVDGEYQLVVRPRNVFTVSLAPIPLLRASAGYSVEADIRMVSGIVGYGLVFDWTSDDDFYMLSIDLASSGGPYYAVRHYTPTGWQMVLSWVKGPALNYGFAANHLKVTRSGDWLYFYANGQLLTSTSSVPAPTVGVKVGVTASNYWTTIAGVRYDNFHVVGYQFGATGVTAARLPDHQRLEDAMAPR